MTEVGVLDGFRSGRRNAIAEFPARSHALHARRRRRRTRTSSPARSSALTARAIEEPIRPSPMIVMRGKAACFAHGNQLAFMKSRSASTTEAVRLFRCRPSGEARSGRP